MRGEVSRLFPEDGSQTGRHPRLVGFAEDSTRSEVIVPPRAPWGQVAEPVSGSVEPLPNRTGEEKLAGAPGP
jgi:hypothetical protein